MLIGRRTLGTISYMGGIMALPEPFVWSWTQMIQYNNEYLCLPTEKIYYDRATVSYHSFARNTLVKRMQGEWLLMLDTDHTFEPDIVARMLFKMERYKIDVLLAPYVFKSPPYAPVLFGYNPRTKNRFVLGKWSKEVDILQIHSGGGGCLMVRKSVFDRIKKELKEEPFDIMPPYSEDHSFFERLFKLGIPAYFAPRIEVKHLIYKELSLETDYDSSKVRTRKAAQVEGFK